MPTAIRVFAKASCPGRTRTTLARIQCSHYFKQNTMQPKQNYSFHILILYQIDLILLLLIEYIINRIRILSIWNKMESLHFMVQIKYYRSNSVQTATLFKILNDKAVYISLDLWNKILTMKWINGEISKWRGSLS